MFPDIMQANVLSRPNPFILDHTHTLKIKKISEHLSIVIVLSNLAEH